MENSRNVKRVLDQMAWGVESSPPGGVVGGMVVDTSTKVLVSLARQKSWWERALDD